jgi:hypothetical protein
MRIAAVAKLAKCRWRAKERDALVSELVVLMYVA